MGFVPNSRLHTRFMHDMAGRERRGGQRTRTDRWQGRAGQVRGTG